MSILSRGWARAVREWVVGVIAIALLCLIIWELSHSIAAAIAVAVVGVWSVWRYVAGSPRGPLVQAVKAWEHDFRSRSASPANFRSASGTSIRGVGTYGGRGLIIKAKVNSRGLLLQLPAGLGTTMLGWRDISTIRETNFDYGGQRQLAANLLLREISHKQLFVPWKEDSGRLCQARLD